MAMGFNQNGEDEDASSFRKIGASTTSASSVKRHKDLISTYCGRTSNVATIVRQN